MDAVHSEEQADASALGSLHVCTLGGDASSHADEAPKACPAKLPWAHGAEKVANNEGVAQLIGGRQISQTEVALPLFVDVLCKKHKPSNKARKGSATYWLVNACRDGCLRCMKCLVEEYGVRKDVRSASGKYNGRDFLLDNASHQCITQPEKDEILLYLADRS